MPTRAFRALGAGCLALVGCWLAPASARPVDGAALTRSTTVRAVSPRHAQHRRKTLRTRAAATARTKPTVSAKAELLPAAESTGAVSTTWTASEPPERACFKSRRKLWQDGEGWVVKSVRVCP